VPSSKSVLDGQGGCLVAKVSDLLQVGAWWPKASGKPSDLHLKSVLVVQDQRPAPSQCLVVKLSDQLQVSASWPRSVTKSKLVLGGQFSSACSQCLLYKANDQLRVSAWWPKVSGKPFKFHLKSVLVVQHQQPAPSQCLVVKLSDQLQVSASWPRSLTNSKLVLGGQFSSACSQCLLYKANDKLRVSAWWPQVSDKPF